MTVQLFDLSNKTALVTGSSRGLGRAIAEALAAAGARIVLNGVDDARLASVVAEMSKSGCDVLSAGFDVTNEKEVISAFESFDKQGIHIDILVNNAGIQFRKPMLELDTDNWQRVIDTNLTAAFVVGREAARRMVPKGEGKIINIGSVTSDLARATIAPYAVSKGGIKMLTKAMAAEWAESGIQTNAIGPGFMITDMNEPLVANEEFNGWVKARTPAGRWGNPDELGGTAIYLASAASNYVNGQMIFADGGMTSVL